jgi:hypothetical protein
MHLTFATPWGAVIAVAGAAALVAVAVGEQRIRRLCRLLGLRPPSGRPSIAVGAAIAGIAVLLALAAAQPVVASEQNKKGRADAEVFVIFDVSHSMAAAETPRSPTRLERARRDAKALRALVPGVPIGIASLNDRLLPHLFPSLSITAFDATADQTIDINRPAAQLSYGGGIGTKLGTIGDIATQGYFGKVPKRLAVVLTDGETLTEGLDSLPSRLRQGHVRAIFVRYWAASEHIFLAGGRIDGGYVPDQSSGAAFQGIAQTVSAPLLEGGHASALAATVRTALGKGPTGPRGRDLGSMELAPYLVLLAFPLLAFVLIRRHAPPGFRLPRLRLRAGGAQG